MPAPTPSSDIVSRHFHKQIYDFADLEKIRMPVVTHNAQATEYSYAAMCELYGDIMPVKKVGQTHIWFTPWDYLIRWWGIEEAMLDMYERPDLVHAAVERMVDAWMVELDQFVAQNLLSLGLRQHADRLRRLRLHVGPARRRTTIRSTSSRTTCGAAPTRRSSRKSRPSSIGSSRWSTTSAG